MNSPMTVLRNCRFDPSGLPLMSLMVPASDWSAQVRRNLSPARTSKSELVKRMPVASHRHTNATSTSRSSIRGGVHRGLIMVAVFNSASHLARDGRRR